MHASVLHYLRHHASTYDELMKVLTLFTGLLSKCSRVSLTTVYLSDARTYMALHAVVSRLHPTHTTPACHFSAEQRAHLLLTCAHLFARACERLSSTAAQGEEVQAASLCLAEDALSQLDTLSTSLLCVAGVGAARSKSSVSANTSTPNTCDALAVRVSALSAAVALLRLVSAEGESVPAALLERCERCTSVATALCVSVCAKWSGTPCESWHCGLASALHGLSQVVSKACVGATLRTGAAKAHARRGSACSAANSTRKADTPYTSAVLRRIVGDLFPTLTDLLRVAYLSLVW
jgi:hypothetical protein